MELTNFTFNKDLIALDMADSYFDLHNNYDFVSCINNVNEVKIKWALTKGDWVPSNLPSQITLNFNGVSYYEQRGDISNVKNLEEFGFFENSTNGNVEYNGLSEPQKGYEVLVFRFINGAEIAIQGMQVSCFIR